MAKNDNKDAVQFQQTRGDIVEVYTDSFDAANRVARGNKAYGARTFDNASTFRSELARSDSDPFQLSILSQKLYATNPIYASLVNYFANMYSWRYTVIPHKLNRAKATPGGTKFQKIYYSMLEIVEGLNLKNILPHLLTQLYTQGSAFFITKLDEESMAISTIIYPSRYAHRIGQSQFGTGIIQLDMSYFDTLGYTVDQLDDLFKNFPKFVGKGYKKYKINATARWLDVDGAVGSCVLLNEKGVPNLVYAYGSMINYEKYGDNEVARSNNKLRYIVTHKMPLNDGMPIFNPDEVKQLHSRLASVVNTTSDSKLLTTYGDINMLRVGESIAQEDKTLLNAYKSVYNNAGLNDIVFTGDSKEALVMSITRDKAAVWNQVQQIMSFYNIAINNYIDFKGYQADVTLLSVSPYSYQADIAEYRSNATLGVGKLQFIVASGIDQKHIDDQLELEDILGLDKIKPLQSSYTGSSSSDEDDQVDDQAPTEAPDGRPSEENPVTSDQPSEEDSPTVRPSIDDIE